MVQDKLELEWSPEQISGWLRQEHPDESGWHVCHETIYQAVYNPARGGLSRYFTKKLRTGRPLRRRRRRPSERAVRFVAPGKLIAHRPAVVLSRVRIGDWEGDLIMGRANRSAIGTLVDRRSGYVVLVHLPAGHSSEAVHDALKQTLAAIPAKIRRTLTWDQGSEITRHDDIAHLLSDGVFFAEPGRPWQRGSNENTNGLLRQYFPKGTDLGAHTAEHLACSRASAQHASAQAARMANTSARPRQPPTLLRTKPRSTDLRFRLADLSVRCVRRVYLSAEGRLVGVDPLS